MLLNELTETVGVPLDELDELVAELVAALVAALVLVALPLPAAAVVELLDLLELPHAATAQQAQTAATTRKSLLFSKLGTSS